MKYLGLNVGLKKVRENVQVLWNDGGQGRSLNRRRQPFQG